MQTRTVQLAPNVYELIESRQGDRVSLFVDEGELVWIAAVGGDCAFNAAEAVQWQSSGDPLVLHSDGGAIVVWNPPSAAAVVSLGVLVSRGVR